MKRPDLPPIYSYHDHFVEMLSFVRIDLGFMRTNKPLCLRLVSRTVTKRGPAFITAGFSIGSK